MNCSRDCAQPASPHRWRSARLREWNLARKIEEPVTLHAKVEGVLLVIDQRLKQLEDRRLRLEMAQGQVFAEARNAATIIASNVNSDAVTRITRLEGRADQLEQERRPPP
jgi:hypothetical protein